MSNPNELTEDEIKLINDQLNAHIQDTTNYESLEDMVKRYVELDVDLLLPNVHQQHILGELYKGRGYEFVKSTIGVKHIGNVLKEAVFIGYSHTSVYMPISRRVKTSDILHQLDRLVAPFVVTQKRQDKTILRFEPPHKRYYVINTKDFLEKYPTKKMLLSRLFNE